MNLFNKRTWRNLALVIVGATTLVACGGTGSCASCVTPTPTPSGSVTLAFTAPSAYPAGIAANVPVMVTNTSNVAATNLVYSIDAATNTTGASVTISEASQAACANLAAQQSCQLIAQIANTPTASHPGAFSVVASSTSTQSTLSKIAAFFELNATTINLANASVGLVAMPANTQTGANGITLYYPTTAVAESGTSGTNVMVTAVVTSTNAGAFNTINLVDGSGNLLNFTVLTGNSGNDMSNLPVGSIVTLLVNIPQGSSQLQFQTQTAVTAAGTSTAVDTAINSNTVVLAASSASAGILNILPNYFNLTTDYESQVITLSNSGNGAISNLSFAVTRPLEEQSSNCGTSLAAGATCQYTIKFNKNLPQAGTSGLIVNYNNGSSAQSATATVNYRGVDPIAGLTITSNNSNFDFTSRTNTPTQIALVTLTNSGNANESGFSFDPVAYFTTNITNVSNPCISTTVLAPGESCSVNLEYNNNAITNGVISTTVPVSYKFGQDMLTAHSDIPVTYQTVQSLASLAITPANYNFGALMNDNGDHSNIVNFIIMNTSDNDASDFTNSITGGYPALFNIVPAEIGTPCGASLKVGESCTISLRFGPSNAGPLVVPANNTFLHINYNRYSGDTSGTSSNSALTGILGTTLAITSVVSSGFESGTNGQTSSYADGLEVLQGSSNATITISYTNNNSTATRISGFTTGGTVPTGWSRTTHGCNNALLEAESSCSDIYQLNTATAGSFNFISSSITSNWSQYGYNFTNQALNLPAAFTSSTVYATVYAPASIAITTNPTPASANVGESFTVVATLSGGYKVADQSISIAPTGNAVTLGLTFNPSNGTCSVNSNSANCTVTVIVPSNATGGTGYTLAIVNQTGTSVPISAVTVTFDVVAGKIIFVTDNSHMHDGNFGGVGGADAVCNANALTFGYAGSYKALLSGNNGIFKIGTKYYTADAVTKKIDLNALVAMATNADTMVSISETLTNAIQPYPSGFNPVTGYSDDWSHGSDGDCGGWQSNDVIKNAAEGYSRSTDSGWLGKGVVQACDTPFKLYCVQQ